MDAYVLEGSVLEIGTCFDALLLMYVSTSLIWTVLMTMLLFCPLRYIQFLYSAGAPPVNIARNNEEEADNNDDVSVKEPPSYEHCWSNTFGPVLDLSALQAENN